LAYTELIGIGPQLSRVHWLYFALVAPSII